MLEFIMTIGVYKLINKTNGKIYIGSSVDIDIRWSQHRNSPSSLIGRALNKYGVDGFIWEIVEETSVDMLLEREQHYMDTLQPFGDTGYNLATVAGSTLGIPCSEDTKRKIAKANIGKFVGNNSSKAKLTTFMSPDSDLIVFPSIGLGCRERRLSISCMAEVARGKRRHYKGWTCPDAPKWKPAARCDHIVLDPDGNEYQIENIKEFSQIHSLGVGAMRRVVTGRQDQHKGWRLPNTYVKTFRLRDLDGTNTSHSNLNPSAENVI